MSRIFITGDTHGTIDWEKINTKNFPVQNELTKDDCLIVLGDFGAVWDGGKTERYILKEYTQRHFTTLFIDGNHENHDLLDTYPVEMWNGGKIHRITDSVFHLMRGQVFTINNKTFFTMGGAQSHDKMYRREGVSWWSREMPSDEECREALTNLEAHGFKVDYILTHCAPESLLYPMYPDLMIQPNALTEFLSRLIINHEIGFTDWYFGHYHRDADIGMFHCLYRSILELD